jgi:hypothetical protein
MTDGVSEKHRQNHYSAAYSSQQPGLGKTHGEKQEKPHGRIVVISHRLYPASRPRHADQLTTAPLRLPRRGSRTFAPATLPRGN